jgi:hypothetical protein
MRGGGGTGGGLIPLASKKAGGGGDTGQGEQLQRVQRDYSIEYQCLSLRRNWVPPWAQRGGNTT